MLPKPQSRIEVLWNKIALGVSDNLPIPQSRLEVLVKALITGDIDNLPIPQSRSEMLLHAILKNEECNLNAQSRVELFLKAILNVDIENLPTPLSRVEVFLDHIVRNGCLEKFEYYPFTFVNYLNVKNTANAKMKIRSIKGKTLVVDANGNEVVAGTEGARLLSVGQDNKNKIEILSGNKDSTVSNKKTISLPEPHRGINDICDEIVYLDETDVNAKKGKGLYHVKNCEELLLDGVNKKFNTTMNVTEAHKRVGFLDDSIRNDASYSKQICAMCDNVVVNSFRDRSKLGMYIVSNGMAGQNAIYWTTDKFLSLTTSDLLAESNNYLKTNPATVVYQLAEPIYTKIDDINDLRSYENETNIFVNGGAIPIMATVEVGTKIGTIVSQLRQEVREIDEKQLQHMKYVLNGDMRAIAEDLYPQDFIETE